MVPDYAMIGGKTQGPGLELFCFRAVPFQHGATIAATFGFPMAVHRSQGVHPTGIIPVLIFQKEGWKHHEASTVSRVMLQSGGLQCSGAMLL